MSSKFVQMRDAVEEFFNSNFHKACTLLAPVISAVGTQALQVGQQIVVNAAHDVATAAANDTAHGTDAMIDVALKSIRGQASGAGVQLAATVSTALAATVVHAAAEAAAQLQNDPGAPK